MYNSSIGNNTLHNLTLINMIVARFVRTGGFFVIYYNCHNAIIISPIKEVLQLFF